MEKMKLGEISADIELINIEKAYDQLKKATKEFEDAAIKSGEFDKSIAQANKSIKELAKENERLAKTGRANSKSYQENAQAISNLNKSIIQQKIEKSQLMSVEKEAKKNYDDVIKVITSLEALSQKTIANYKAEGMSLSELQSEEKSLLEIRKNVGGVLGENDQALAALNDALKSNKQAQIDIKKATLEQLDALEKLKLNYKEAKEQSQLLGAEMLQLAEEGKKDTQMYKDKQTAYTETTAAAKKYSDQLKELESNTGVTGRNVGNYAEGVDDLKTSFSGLSEAMSKLKSGDVSGFFNTLKTSISGVGKALLSLLANPIGLAVAAIGALVAGGYKVMQMNEEWRKQNSYLSKSFGELGDQLEPVRSKIQGISETYEVEFDKITDVANKMVKSGLAKDIGDALEQISLTMAQSKDKDDALQNFQEYADIMAMVGYSADEARGLILEMQSQGAKTDYVLDQLKDGMVKFGAEASSMKDLLAGAFGEDFANNLVDSVNSGKISMVEAMDMMKQKIDEVGISQENAAILGEKLFNSQVTEVGGLVKVLDMVQDGYKKANQELTPYQQAQEDLRKTNEQLENAYASLFDKTSEGWGQMKLDLEILAKKWLLGVITQVINWYNSFVDLYNQSKGLRISLSALFQTVAALMKNTYTISKSVFDGVLDVIKGVVKSVVGLGEAIAGALTFDGELMKRGVANVYNGVTGIVKDIALDFKSMGDGIVNDWSSSMDKVVKNSGKLKKIDVNSVLNTDIKEGSGTDGVKKTPTYTGDTSSANEEKGSKKGSGKDKVKEAEGIQKAINKAELDLLKAQIDEKKALLDQEFKEQETITKKKIDAKQKELKALFELQEKELEAERQEQLRAANSESKSVEEKNKRIEAIEKSYSNSITALKKETEEKKLAFDKQYTDELKEWKNNEVAAEIEKLAMDLDNSNRITLEKQLELSNKQFENDQDYQDLKREQKELLKEESDNADIVNDEAYIARKASVEQQIANIEYNHEVQNKKIREQSLQQKLDAVKTVAQNVISILGEETVAGKIAATAMAIIDTYQGANAQMKLPYPYNIIAATTTVAVGLMNVAKINSTKADTGTSNIGEGQTVIKKVPLTKPQIEKHAKGGVLNGRSHSQGGMPFYLDDEMHEVEGGEFIINKDATARHLPTLKAINSNTYNPVNTATVQTHIIEKQAIDQRMIDAIASSVYEGSVNGTFAGSNEGVSKTTISDRKQQDRRR